ncbi:MAG: hypothetical protein QM723_17985 [Myxococcaceae bacterium]
MKLRHIEKTPATQGALYLATGLWPIVHLKSFQAVTGAKRQKWLARTYGGITVLAGASLLLGAVRRSRLNGLRDLAATLGALWVSKALRP